MVYPAQYLSLGTPTLHTAVLDPYTAVIASLCLPAFTRRLAETTISVFPTFHDEAMTLLFVFAHLKAQGAGFLVINLRTVINEVESVVTVLGLLLLLLTFLVKTVQSPHLASGHSAKTSTSCFNGFNDF